MPDVPVLADGPNTPNGQRAFHLGAEGVGRLFAAVYEVPDPKNPQLPRDVAYPEYIWEFTIALGFPSKTCAEIAPDHRKLSEA